MPAHVHKPRDGELSQYRVRGEIPVPALIDWLTLAAVPMLAFFAVRARMAQDTQTVEMLALFALLLSLNALAYTLTRIDTLHRRGFIIFISVLFFYLATAAIEDGAAIMWLFAYPPIIFYISKSPVGVIACSGGFVSLMLLFSPLGDAALIHLTALVSGW